MIKSAAKVLIIFYTYKFFHEKVKDGVNLVSTFVNLKTGCKPDKHWVLTTCQPIHKKITVKYKIVGFCPPFLAMAEFKLGSAHLA